MHAVCHSLQLIPEQSASAEGLFSGEYRDLTDGVGGWQFAEKTRANVCSRYDGSLDDPSWAVELSKSPCYSLSRIISRQRWYPWETGPNPVLENINMLIIRPSISLGVRVCIQVNESELITQQGGRRAGEEKAKVPQ